MKPRPSRSSCALGVLCVALLAGPSARVQAATPSAQAAEPDEPAQPDEPLDAEEATALEAGRTFTGWFLGGEDDALWKAFAPEMRAAMGDQPATLAAFRHQVDAQLGAEAEVISEDVQRRPGALVYVRTARFEKTEQRFAISFTFPAGTTSASEGAVAGFLIQPERTEAPSDYLDHETRTELHLPFDGDWTVIWGGRTLEENYHTFTRDQRFAYDILMMKDGKTHDGDGTELEDYYCFGQVVRAPGAGIAVAARDGLKDNPPGVMDPEHALGNHVIIDHGNGEYSFLAHLKKGSLAIEKGDRVEVGTLLGVCGNSGNTSEPHIHYHLQDTPDFGKGQGMPAQFQDYLLDGEPVERGEPVRLQVIRNP